jgi:hypothetical protein
MSTATMPTIAEFVASHPDADPKELLQVVMAETERLNAQFALTNEKNAAREHEFKIASEVELDDNLTPNPKTLAQLFRVSRMFVDGGLVPQAYLNEEKGVQPVPAVAISLMAAKRCGVDHFTFLQHSFPHKGKIGLDSQLAIGMLIKSGKIKGRPNYAPVKDSAGQIIACTCSVVDAESNETFSQTVTWEHVTKEGWDKPKGTQTSKWMTLRELMFQYRSGIWVMRVHYPDVLMGMYSTEELEDISRSNGDSGSASVTTTGLDELSERLGAAPKPSTGAPGRGRPRKSAETKPAETKPAGHETTELNNETDAEPTPPNALQRPPTSSQAAADAKPPTSQTAKKQPGTTPAKSSNSTSSAAVSPGRPQNSEKTAPNESNAGKSAAPGAASPGPGSPGAESPRPTSQAETLALDDLKDYIREQYPDDCENFDVDRLAKMALGQLEQREYVDSIMLRKNPNWRRYAIASPNSSTAPGAESSESQEAGDSSDESQDSTSESGHSQDVPDFMVNKVARPRNFMMPGTHLERTIMGYRQAKRIRDLITSHIKGHPDLDASESAYLLQLAERRAWQLEQGTPFEALAKETQIPA